MKIFVSSKTDGFRRAGVAHSAKGQEFDEDFFTEEQLEQLDEDSEITMVAGMPDDGEKDPDKVPTKDELLEAAKKAIADNNIIGSGEPSVDAMEKILGCNVSAAQRTQAYMDLQQENDD